jgi:hypothetical protein
MSLYSAVISWTILIGLKDCSLRLFYHSIMSTGYKVYYEIAHSFLRELRQKLSLQIYFTVSTLQIRNLYISESILDKK